MSLLSGLLILGSASLIAGCDSCYGPSNPVIHQRLSRRQQPESLNATTPPKKPLEWGQLNFLHTTDTHGWLEGHLKERNYGADWGDFVSFTRHMRHMAGNYDVDLLLIDTGDLHDGAGLSDASSPNGLVSNPIFEEVDYDLLTIGNHELYLQDIAYETFANFSKFYGDKYLTSNVQILNQGTGQYEYIGKQFRYFTTQHGLRIMAFGVLFDFTGNTNYTKVIKANTLVTQSWFLEVVNYTQPIDLFLLIGHNPVRFTDSSSTLDTVYAKIRSLRPDVPIQVFGGHTHIRDFAVYDSMGTGLESGRYCETLGWLSMSGLESDTYTGLQNPRGVPNPTTPAVKLSTATASASAGLPFPTNATSSALRYSRRYIDWNRLSFAYHAGGSQDTFDYHSGLRVSSEITSDRQALNLSAFYGCAPQTYCISCVPYRSNGSLFSLLDKALAATVVNPDRADVARLIIINTGSVRFDLVQGPFTYDDSFIVSPFNDAFEYIPDVPYSIASQVLPILNAGPYQKRKRDLSTADFNFDYFTGADGCTDELSPKSPSHSHPDLKARYITRRQVLPATVFPGYVTTDDFGNDGDDTKHSAIPRYSVPNDLQSNASFPADSSLPDTVDLIFLDFIGPGYVLPALQKLGANYSTSDLNYYLPQSFTTNSYLPQYAQQAWSKGPCAVGEPVGG